MTLRFIDTNILIYAIGSESIVDWKTRIAGDLLQRRDCALSVQVLQEFYVQSTRLTRIGFISHELAVGFIEKWSRFPVQDMTRDVLKSALDIKQRHHLSYWDAAVVAAARALGCGTLYSEDMAHGMTIGSTTIVNPFL